MTSGTGTYERAGEPRKRLQAVTQRDLLREEITANLTEKTESTQGKRVTKASHRERKRHRGSNKETETERRDLERRETRNDTPSPRQPQKKNTPQRERDIQKEKLLRESTSHREREREIQSGVWCNFTAPPCVLPHRTREVAALQ